MNFSKIFHSSINGKDWTLVHDDCLKSLEKIQKNSIDLIITSPPYNLGNSSGGGFPTKKTGKWSGGSLASGYGNHNDSMPKKEYREWQKRVLLACWKTIVDDGAIFYNHKPRIQNGLLEHPLDWNPDLPVRQIIIWKRSGGINFSSSFYLPTHEYIIIYAKQRFRLKSKNCGEGDVWEVNQDKKTLHPAPFPIEIPDRILKTVKKKNGIVIDPFAGSSSTGIAALMNNYTYLGIDNEKEYIELSKSRLKQFTNTINMFEGKK